jgi:hypothetical protein
VHLASGHRARDGLLDIQHVEYAIDVIQMRFLGYCLAVADFIRRAKDDGIAADSGRGSGDGLIVAYALGTTDLIRSDLATVVRRILPAARRAMRWSTAPRPRRPALKPTGGRTSPCWLP